MRAGLTMLALILVTAATAAGQVVMNPTAIEFTASSDHVVVAADGSPVVTRYEARFYLGGAASPVQVHDLGKPAPGVNDVIRVANPAMFAVPIVTGTETYTARVAAIGPGGEGLSEPSGPFSRIKPPTAPGAVRVSR